MGVVVVMVDEATTVFPVEPVTNDDVIVLPWWRSPLNIALMALIAVLAAFSAGWAMGGKDSALDHNDVDVGFMQDMRIHHEQAVTMSVIYNGVAPKGNPLLSSIAREIVIDQSTEAGRMVQLLRMFHASETNETETAMSWMGMPMPLSKMTGMASDAEMQDLYQARGVEAQRIFATLMIAHHEGGVHMAEYVVTHGRNPEVVGIARGIIASQNGEIRELRGALAKLD